MMASFRRPIDVAEWNAVESIIHEKYSDEVDTLCDHVRVIYKIADGKMDSPRMSSTIKEECKIIMVYAKRMDKKLKALQNVEEYEL